MFRSLVLVLVVGASCAFAQEVDSYPTTYDHLDVPATLANDRLRDQYYACFMDKAPCLDASAKFFKGILHFLLITTRETAR